MDERDPRAKYRHLPARPPQADWITVHETVPVPGSVRAADEDAAMRAARRTLELAAGPAL